ncbi:MAG: hypothetical protein ACTSR5_02965 [Promethearchaeota archaeon]
MGFEALIDRLLKGDPRAAARLITIAENDIGAAEEIINSIYKHTGKADYWSTWKWEIHFNLNLN